MHVLVGTVSVIQNFRFPKFPEKFGFVPHGIRKVSWPNFIFVLWKELKLNPKIQFHPKTRFSRIFVIGLQPHGQSSGWLAVSNLWIVQPHVRKRLNSAHIVLLDALATVGAIISVKECMCSYVNWQTGVTSAQAVWSKHELWYFSMISVNWQTCVTWTTAWAVWIRGELCASCEFSAIGVALAWAVWI